MAELNGEIIQWKKLYQLISGIHYATAVEVVEEKLLEVTKELQDGILTFKPKNPTSKSKLEAMMKEENQEKMLPFTQKLYNFLDLDEIQSWELLCFYLVNEYRGSASSLSNYISSESAMLKLLTDIWYYYSLERMVLLKITRNLLEFFHDAVEHPYNGVYKCILDKIGLANLRKSYIDQFEHLVKEIRPIPLQGDIFNSPLKLQSWAERQLREMNEILQIILLTVHFDGIKAEELKKLVDLFKLHSFGKHNQIVNSTSESHNDLVRKITYSEIALLLVALNTKDQDNGEWVAQVISELEAQINGFHQYPEHGPILLMWMLFNFHAQPNEEESNSLNKYRQFGFRAVQLGVFEFLLKLVSHKIFSDKSLVAKIVRKSLYDHLSLMCELFDSDGSMSQHSKIFELLSEVLSTPSIANEFCKHEDGPLRSLFNSAMEIFPIDFAPLTMVAQSLSSAGATSNKYIREQFENLPLYSEMYNGNKYQLRQGSDDEFILLNDYAPFDCLAQDFIIPRGTKVVVVDNKFTSNVHFRIKLNYFHVLHNEIKEMLISLASSNQIDMEKVHRLEYGVKFLATAIRRINNPAHISTEMIHPVEMTLEIMVKLKDLPSPPLELLASCLDLCTELLPLYFDDISTRIVSFNVLPSIHNKCLDFKSYTNGTSYESGLVGYYLVNIERTRGKYSFLKAYLKFLKNYTKLNNSTIFDVELPGLIFLLREVFSNAHSWRFEMEEDKFDIYIAVLQYMFDILQLPADQLKKDKARVTLRNVCLNSLLQQTNGTTLLRFVSIGNPALQSFMENESNWMVAAEKNLNLLVQLSMTILMQILRLKSSLLPDQLTPLEELIYTQPKQRDTLRIIPIVTNYMTSVFNRRLPLLSCRLLRRFALEFQRSLSACLNMEPDQIRMTFLQRLRDDLETNDLKIAILEFVDACIEKQPGLTEAFFKVTYEHDDRYAIKPKKTTNISDGILVYMEEYLEAVSSDPSQLVHPQLSRIMSLFHALWKNNMQMLVSSLIEKETFWMSLCNPLLSKIDLKERVKAYAQLFNILGLELFKLNNDICVNFKKVVEEFMAVDNFKNWIKYVFAVPLGQSFDSEPINTEDVPEWLSLLQSFKDFIVLLLKKKDLISIPMQSKKFLMDSCVKSLVHQSEGVRDLRPFIVTSELYLILLNEYSDKYTDDVNEDVQLLQDICRLLNLTAETYTELHKRAKDSVLAISIKCLDMLADEIVKQPEIAGGFVSAIVDIVCSEIFALEVKVKSPEVNVEDEKELTILLSVNLLKKIIMTFDSKQESIRNWENWFNHKKIFNRLLSVVSAICPIYSKKKISAELLDLLVLFAKGNCSKELLYCDIGDYLWLKLLPPKELLERPYVQPNETTTKWRSQEWWMIYSKGIELNKMLLKQHKHLFCKDSIFFVGIHEEFLIDCLLLAKQTFEPNAVKLIKMTLEFLVELVKYNNEWRLENSQSLQSVMRCIQILMEHCVSLMYRPKILKQLTESSKTMLVEDLLDQQAPEASEALVEAMNSVIEIISLCTTCLLPFSPNLLNLICDIRFLNSKYSPLIEIHFAAPKFGADTSPQLSFGTVLSAIHLLTKALTVQQHTFHEIALNRLPQEDTIDNPAEVSSIFESSLTVPGSPRPSFSKNLSMNSVSSVVLAPSNEFLTHLNPRICLIALEFVLTLLASQSLLALKDENLSTREKQLIRRELSTELHSYHTFVKRIVLKDGSGTRSNLKRKKHGIFKISSDEVEDPVNVPVVQIRKSMDNQKSLRVNVIRKQHLQKKSTTPFDVELSPISGAQKSDHQPINVTPIRSILKPTTSTSHKRVGFNLDVESGKVLFAEEEDNDEPILLEPSDAIFTGLSYVKLVEEDYFAFMSNLFLVVCQTEN